MLIDTHCHINFNAFREDADEIIKKTLSKNIWIINVGSKFITSERAVFYAQKYKEGVYASVALHPIHVEEGGYDASGVNEQTSVYLKGEEFNYEKFKNLAQNKKVVAIGETGIDCFHITPSAKKSANEIKEKQIEIFKQHIKLAKELKKPLIIHCRDAHKDVLELLKNYYGGDKKNENGVIHFFSGSLQEAREYINLGFLLSFTGVITFYDKKGNYAGNFSDVIKNVSLEKLMAETDAPYVAPEPFRGKRNQPLYVEYVVKRIAEIKGISFEEAADQTTKNAKRLFKI